MRAPRKHNIPVTYAVVENGHHYPFTPKNLQRFRAVDNGILDRYAREEVKNVNDIEVAKPGWFLAEERRARRFVDSLGFSAAKGTAIACIATDDPEKYELAMGEGSIESRYYAVHTPGVGIVVPLEIAEATYAKSGHVGLASVISHELTHSAGNRSLHALVRLYMSDSERWGNYMGRSGFSTFDGSPGDKADEGSFLDEALASHVGGLYRRRYFDKNAPLNSITSEPKDERPSFYSDYLPPRPDGKPSMAGHDAYTLEMISWKAHEIGITPTSHTLIEAMYKTVLLDKSLQLEGLRAVPHIINGVKPGLYADLRSLTYDRDERIVMMHSVYDTVSK